MGIGTQKSSDTILSGGRGWGNLAAFFAESALLLKSSKTSEGGKEPMPPRTQLTQEI
jgi:hypothetical protein